MQHRIGLPQPQPPVQIARLGLPASPPASPPCRGSSPGAGPPALPPHPPSPWRPARVPRASGCAGAVPFASSGTGTPGRLRRLGDPLADGIPHRRVGWHVGQQRLPAFDRLQRLPGLRGGRRQVEPRQTVAGIGFQHLSESRPPPPGSPFRPRPSPASRPGPPPHPGFCRQDRWRAGRPPPTCPTGSASPGCAHTAAIPRGRTDSAAALSSSLAVASCKRRMLTGVGIRRRRGARGKRLIRNARRAQPQIAADGPQTHHHEHQARRQSDCATARTASPGSGPTPAGGAGFPAGRHPRRFASAGRGRSPGRVRATGRDRPPDQSSHAPAPAEIPAAAARGSAARPERPATRAETEESTLIIP